MNIGIVCYPTYGGSGVLATELGLGLANKGHKVHFITYRMPARLPSFHEHIYYHEVNAYDYPLFEYAPYESALASKMVHVAVSEQLDLLHVHYAIPHASVAYLCREILKSKGMYIPFVTTLHGTDITLVGSDPSFAPVVEFSINASDGVTAVSQFLKKLTESTFDVKIPIDVIYNFVDIQRFKIIDKGHFKKAIAPNGERILMHISNFRKVKRIDDIVTAFHKISSQIPSKLILVGDGPERLTIEKQVTELGLQSQVVFLGKQDAIEEILAISDLFMLPSETESFGLSALEAMACGVPVISSNAGGLTEVNLHGVTGFTVEVGDTDKLADHAIELLNNNEMHASFSAAAFERAEYFNVDKIVCQYEKYYQKIISNTRK